MKEFQKIANDRIQAMVDDGTIQKTIENGIEKAITKAIDGQFDSWGNITKQIKEAMDKGLQVNTDDLPFETYNQQMLILIKTRLGTMFQGLAAERFLS